MELRTSAVPSQSSKTQFTGVERPSKNASDENNRMGMVAIQIEPELKERLQRLSAGRRGEQKIPRERKHIQSDLFVHTIRKTKPRTMI